MYGKITEGVFEQAPKNYQDENITICNFDLDEDLMKEYGFKPVIECEKPVTDRYWEIAYTENEEEIQENVTYTETEEEYQARKRQEIGRLSLTKREVFLALYDDKGLKPEQVRAQITDEKALIEFDHATEYYRGNPLIDSIGALLGYTSADLDYLFEHKELPNESIS